MTPKQMVEILDGQLTDCYAEISEQQGRIAELESELHTMKTAGIIEAAVRNPAVSEYMAHWEGRTEKAQDRIAELEAALRPFARHVDKSSCEITMVWRDGDYVSTYTDTLKPSDFWAATTALNPNP
jgi:hypothetical protein